VGSLSTVKRADGTVQVTYKGMPLYTFAQDHAPGEANGEGLKDVGTWKAITTTAAAKAAAPAPAAPAAPPSRATRTSARAAAGDPAVEREHRSGEIRAGSRGEEDRQPRSVVGPADAPEGAVLPEMSNRALIRIRESSQSANSAGRFSRKAATASGSARPKVLMVC